MKRRGSAVLDAPERDYAPGTSGPRRAAGGLRREMQAEFGRDFAPNYGASDEDYVERGSEADGFDSDGYGSGAGRRGGGKGAARRGFLGWLPESLWGRIGAGVGVAAVLGLGVAGALAVRSAVLHDERFVIPTSAAIAIEGNQHVTKAQLLSIFGEDVERNIFTVPLAERRAELERLPWVEHATVMRLLPDHLKVSIGERTPVAFVRQGGHIGLVDKSGVLMDMGSGTGSGSGSGEQYSFPVVTGISGDEPQSTRAARMKIFARFTRELDAGGAKISDKLSEVDLASPEDVKALIPDDVDTGGPDTVGSAKDRQGSSKQGELLVHFGDSDFLDRYNKYRAHLAEWRAQYPRLASVDMRYDLQAVLKMQPESAAAVAAPPVSRSIEEKAASAPVGVPAKGVVPGSGSVGAAPPIAGSTGAVKAGSTTAGSTQAGKSAVSGTAATALPVQGGASNGTVHHLMIAKDVPAKKVVAKKPVGKKATLPYHPPAVAP